LGQKSISAGLNLQPVSTPFLFNEWRAHLREPKPCGIADVIASFQYGAMNPPEVLDSYTMSEDSRRRGIGGQNNPGFGPTTVGQLHLCVSKMKVFCNCHRKIGSFLMAFSSLAQEGGNSPPKRRNHGCAGARPQINR
jgi:hypothetical protein